MTVNTHAERLDLAAEPSSVGQARAFVSGVLMSWGLAHLAETAALLTSELASNVVLHARTPYAVVLTRTMAGARVDVLDASEASPVLRSHDLSAPTGRGLALLAALAVEWGWTPREDLVGFTKGVRFALA